MKILLLAHWSCYFCLGAAHLIGKPAVTEHDVLFAILHVALGVICIIEARQPKHTPQ